MIQFDKVQGKYSEMMRVIEQAYEYRGNIPEPVMHLYRACAAIYYRSVDTYIEQYGPLSIDPDMVEGAKVDIFGQNLSEFERDIIHLINRKLDEVNFLARQRTVSRSFESTSSLDEKRALADQPVVSLAKTISITKYQGERNERYR